MMIIKVTTLNHNNSIVFCALCDFGLGMQHSKEKIEKMYQWSFDKFGPPKKNLRWNNQNNKFYFQKETDLALFLLYWS